MIEAKHVLWFQYMFSVYLSYSLKLHFRKIDIIGDVKDRDMPFLVISNHISWWDGFWILNMNNKTFKRKFYVMMLEEQLKQNMFLRKLGAFSINKKSKTLFDSLEYASKLLKNKSNMLLFFAQGSIQSQHKRQFVFEKGLDRILKEVDNNIQVLFVANLLDYYSFKKPALNQFLCSPEKTTGFSIQELEEHYNDFYKDSINKQIAAL